MVAYFKLFIVNFIRFLEFFNIRIEQLIVEISFVKKLFLNQGYENVLRVGSPNFSEQKKFLKRLKRFLSNTTQLQFN